MRTAAAFSSLAAAAAGHGGLTIPTPRSNRGGVNPMHASSGSYNPRHDGPCAGDTCYWFSMGCTIGCPHCTGAESADGPDGTYNCTGFRFPSGHTDCNLHYDFPRCADPAEPTLPARARTFNVGGRSDHGDWTRYHPWRAPGRAPVLDPCGAAGGWKGNCTVPVGAKKGDLGSQLPPLTGFRTEWAAGGVAEVAWMIAANHGGGYHYSVCPKQASLTEACFQRNSLAFVGSEHTIRWLDGSRPAVGIPALSVSEGTFPDGSVWRRNPIPACNCDSGGGLGDRGACQINGVALRRAYSTKPEPDPNCPRCPTGVQFPAPFKDGCDQQMWNQRNGTDADKWVIVDQVRVPDEEGDYVLRWRWDTEQGSQVWTNCADVSVIKRAA